MTSKEKDTFVTTKSFYKLISYLNDDKYEIVLHDKILFNTIFKKYLKIFYEFFTRFGGTGKEENQILWKAVKSLDFTVFCEKKIIAFLVISYYNKIQRL